MQRNAVWHIPRSSAGVTVKFSPFVVEILCRLGGTPPAKKMQPIEHENHILQVAFFGLSDPT